jgi:hypothetical protein
MYHQACCLPPSSQYLTSHWLLCPKVTGRRVGEAFLLQHGIIDQGPVGDIHATSPGPGIEQGRPLQAAALISAERTFIRKSPFCWKVIDSIN